MMSDIRIVMDSDSDLELEDQKDIDIEDERSKVSAWNRGLYKAVGWLVIELEVGGVDWEPFFQRGSKKIILVFCFFFAFIP